MTMAIKQNLRGGNESHRGLNVRNFFRHARPEFIHQKLHPHPIKRFKHPQREAYRTRSAVEVQHGSSPQAFNAKPTRPDQPLRFSMSLPLRRYHPQRFIHQKLRLNPKKCSIIFNAKPTDQINR